MPKIDNAEFKKGSASKLTRDASLKIYKKIRAGVKIKVGMNNEQQRGLIKKFGRRNMPT